MKTWICLGVPPLASSQTWTSCSKGRITGKSLSMHLIGQLVSVCLIHSIVINPVDCAIHRVINWGLVFNDGLSLQIGVAQVRFGESARHLQRSKYDTIC